MKIIGIILLAIIFASPSFAQEAIQIEGVEDIPCEEYLSRIERVIQFAQDNPQDFVYVLIYEGKEKRFVAAENKWISIPPARGAAKAKIKSLKRYFEIYKISPNQFVFIEAGFRQNLEAEFWLVPAGASLPQLKPTLKKMKYRKGKARGFCITCCPTEF